MHSAGSIQHEYHTVTIYEVGANFSKRTVGSIAGFKGNVQQYVLRYVRKESGNEAVLAQISGENIRVGFYIMLNSLKVVYYMAPQTSYQSTHHWFLQTKPNHMKDHCQTQPLHNLHNFHI
jgi:hypothetical protein